MPIIPRREKEHFGLSIFENELEVFCLSEVFGLTDIHDLRVFICIFSAYFLCFIR